MPSPATAELATLDGSASQPVKIGSFEFHVEFCEHTAESRARFESRESTLASWLLLEWMRHQSAQLAEPKIEASQTEHPSWD